MDDHNLKKVLLIKRETNLLKQNCIASVIRLKFMMVYLLPRLEGISVFLIKLLQIKCRIKTIKNKDEKIKLNEMGDTCLNLYLIHLLPHDHPMGSFSNFFSMRFIGSGMP